MENQFEKFKYLEDELFTFSNIENIKISSNLAGIPRKMWKDVSLRFFKNYLSVIALIVFLTIIIMSLIIPLISPYGVNSVILPIDANAIKSIPPSYAPIVSETLSESNFISILHVLGIKIDGKITAENIENIIKNSNGIINKIIILDANAGFLVTYDKFLYVNTLIFQYNEANLGTIGNLSTILGTDNQGYDIWTRTWGATRDSLFLALAVVVTEAIIGIIIGAYLGFFAGTWIDNILTRIIDVIKNIPIIMLFLMFMTFFNSVNFWSMYFSMILIGWTPIVYLTRLWIITVKDQEFVKASKAIGAKTNRQIFIHALPMIIGKLATSLVSRITSVILLVSSLAFLGFIPAGGNANLGTILKEAVGQATTNVWILLLPSIVLLLTSLSTQFIANGVHDSLDPQAERK
ncbi:MAG: ABC transporter permease [Metamycoplasmataceae bacterium]